MTAMTFVCACGFENDSPASGCAVEHKEGCEAWRATGGYTCVCGKQFKDIRSQPVQNHRVK
jgi:hypothetical protein